MDGLHLLEVVEAEVSQVLCDVRWEDVVVAVNDCLNQLPIDEGRQPGRYIGDDLGKGGSKGGAFR